MANVNSKFSKSLILLFTEVTDLDTLQAGVENGAFEGLTKESLKNVDVEELVKLPAFQKGMTKIVKSIVSSLKSSLEETDDE